MNDRVWETGLIGGPEKRAIEIVKYDSSWPVNFQIHADIIARALTHTIVCIEHIGSTSVPGLAAKPIVDILAVVKDAADEDSYVPQMTAIGYELRVREPDFFEHRMFRTPARDIHIHFFSPDSPEIERYLVFRDRLRLNEIDRQLYEQTKRRLANLDWPDTNDYANAKSEVVEAIIAAAKLSS